MTAALLYIFAFSTWGLGLVTWLVWLGTFIQRHNVDLETRKASLAKAKLSLMSLGGFMLPRPSQQSRSDIPEQIKQYMQSSQGHPEVEEIDSEDVIVGIKFEGSSYPPDFDDEDDGE